MGTNLVDFLAEAHRILIKGGRLKIAEVKSRFENLQSFEKALWALGFDLVSKNEENKMFVILDLIKSDRQSRRTKLVLKPCLYKKR